MTPAVLAPVTCEPGHLVAALLAHLAPQVADLDATERHTMDVVFNALSEPALPDVGLAWRLLLPVWERSLAVNGLNRGARPQGCIVISACCWTLAKRTPVGAVQPPLALAPGSGLMLACLLAEVWTALPEATPADRAALQQVATHLGTAPADVGAALRAIEAALSPELEGGELSDRPTIGLLSVCAWMLAREHDDDRQAVAAHPVH